MLSVVSTTTAASASQIIALLGKAKTVTACSAKTYDSAPMLPVWIIDNSAHPNRNPAHGPNARVK